MKRLALLVFALLAFACNPYPAQAQTGPPPDPSYDANGVAVGRDTITVTDPARNRTFKIDIWFPAQQATDTYSELDLVVTQLQTLAFANAQIRPGQYPLVLFSHAHDSDRFQSFQQMENIASHGFIVAAPSHPGDTLADKIYGTTDGFQEILQNRYWDMIFTKDTLLTNAKFAPNILMDGPGDPRMATTGHSTGAATALALLDGQADAWMTLPPDPDVDAAVAIGPALMFYTPDSWTPDGTTDKPLMIIGGSADQITPPAYSQQLWDTWESTIKFRAQINGMTHAEPSSGCFIRDAVAVHLWNNPNDTLAQQVLSSLNGTMNGGCDQPPPTMLHWYDVQRTVQAFETPFLLRRLKLDSSYETWLSRERSNRGSNLANDYWRCTPATGVCDTSPS